MSGQHRSSGPGGGGQEGRQEAEIGFFPAITHFTDSISALPKEMIRHYSMLKEVDAKICGPEEVVGQLITTTLRTPIPFHRLAPAPQFVETARSEIDGLASTAGTADNISIKSVPSQIEVASTATQEELASRDLSRRQLFHRLRACVQEMLPTLDEKNHVLSTAVDGLDKQLTRCKSSYPYIEDEISEEARYGSLTHWAYTEKSAEKKGTTAGERAGERTRRDAAAANQLATTAPAVYEAEGAALRSELRRQAIAERRQRNHHHDSDFDDGRGVSHSTTKKHPANSRGRKVADTTLNGTGVGLGIANGSSAAAPPSKRRKVERSAPNATLGGVPMVRAMSSVYGSNMGSTRGAGTSPRATPIVETAKKRGRTATQANGTGRKRYTNN